MDRQFQRLFFWRVKNNFDLSLLATSSLFVALSLLILILGYGYKTEAIRKSVIDEVQVPLQNGKTSPQKALLVETYLTRPALPIAQSGAKMSLLVSGILGALAFWQKDPVAHRKSLREAKAFVDAINNQECEKAVRELTDFYFFQQEHFPSLDADDPRLILAFYLASTEQTATIPLKPLKEPPVRQNVSLAQPADCGQKSIAQPRTTFSNPSFKRPEVERSEPLAEETVDAPETLIDPQVSKATGEYLMIGKMIEAKHNAINKRNPIYFAEQILTSGVLTRFYYRVPLETDISKVASVDLANLNYSIAPYSQYDRVAINPNTLYNEGRSYISIDCFLSEPVRVAAHDVLIPSYSDQINFEMLIGLDEMNSPITIDLSNHFNGLFAGIPGSGKSRTALGAVYSLMCKNTPEQLRLRVIDGKGAWKSWNKKDNGEWLPWLDASVASPSDPTEMIQICEDWIAISRQRTETFGHDDLKAWNLKHPEQSRPMLLLFVDEYEEACKVCAEEGFNLEDKIKTLVQLGRAAGIRVILSNQIFTSENSSQGIRSLPDYKVCLKVKNPNSLKQIFLSMPGNISPPTAKGHFYWATDQAPAFGHSLWIDELEMLKLLGVEPPPEVFLDIQLQLDVDNSQQSFDVEDPWESTISTENYQIELPILGE